MTQKVKSEELVSVVIPVYNRVELLCDTINSVQMQTYQNIEILIIDDCSSEDIHSKVLSLKDDRIRYYRNSENMGANYSRNQGILHSAGRYIAFQDSADIWKPEKLEKQMQVFLENETIDAVYCETGFENQTGKLIIVPDRNIGEEERNQNIYHTLLRQNIIDTPGLMVKKECLIAVGMFDTEMPRLQEWELCLRLAAQYKFQCVNEVLSTGTYRNDSISANWMKLVIASSLLVKKHREEMEAENVILCNILKFFRQALMDSDNKITVEELKSDFFNAYGKDVLKVYGITETVLNDIAKDYRFRKYYSVSSEILNKISQKTGFEFDFSGKSVAIYGFGTLGKILYQELRKEKIDIKFIIDNAVGIEAEVPVYQMSEITENHLVDIIIVTPIYDFLSIQEQLNKIRNYQIVSLDAVFGTNK